MKALVRTIIGELFLHYKYPNRFKLPDNTIFSVEIIGDDVICDFGDSGQNVLTGYRHLFKSLWADLREHNLDLTVTYTNHRKGTTERWDVGTLPGLGRDIPWVDPERSRTP